MPPTSRRLALALSGGLVALAMVVAPVSAGGRPFTTDLTGAAEVPGPGDPDGSGTARVWINPGLGEVCFSLEVEGLLLPATGAHIHAAPSGVAGGVVVPLMAPDASGTSSGCVSASRTLLVAILEDPSAYYVNVHTTEHPAGAVRGQLSRQP
jgi:hypothetical protein